MFKPTLTMCELKKKKGTRPKTGINILTCISSVDVLESYHTQCLEKCQAWHIAAVQ